MAERERRETEKVVIYGDPSSRANRSCWMASELGVPFELRFVPKVRDPDIPNPNKKQPYFIDTDGTTTIFESIAINLYLIRKYGAGNPLAPTTPNEEAKVLQWSVWAMTELDPRLSGGHISLFYVGPSSNLTEQAVAELVQYGYHLFVVQSVCTGTMF